MRLNFVHRAQFVSFSGHFRSYKSLLPLILVAGLAGCGSVLGDSEPDTSTPLGSVVGPERNARGLTGIGQATADDNLATKSGGFVVADEPTAALVARDVLERGGSVVDAATALYFTLSVTQPVAASLGGGGICLVHDRIGRKTESVEFLPRRATAGGSVAVPGNVRGFALLHAKYGQLPWESLLAAPERMAAIGTPVSRAMARSLAPHAAALSAEPALASSLLSPSSSPLRELETAVQIELASTLGRVRSRGVAALYGGDGAVAFARTIADAGGLVSASDLQNYRPTVSVAAMLQMDGVQIYTPSLNVGAGAYASALWSALQNVSPADSAGAARAANATAGSLGAQGMIPDDLGSTGFAVVSARGNAVACAVTMNGALGTGRTAPGTGVILASSPDEPTRGLGGAFLAPVLATGLGNSTLVFAGASGGGPVAAAGVQQLVRQSFGGQRQNLSTALQNATPSTSSALVNAIVCPTGLLRGTNNCEIGVDPDGSGLGVEAVGR